jgi:asparagine synthase (glutamine-hydrolysing)
MCGIVGYFSHDQSERLSGCIDDASQVLSHRGPDDAGTYRDASNGVGLGHRRLSIIDLSAAGHQPMASTDGKYVIAFNGEIYNFVKIRQDLQQLGYKFNSHSDTEVILNAYRQWGLACLERFVGMFAFAIWDNVEKRIFAARDRIGIKPFYYFFKDGTLIFASELKALMAFRGFPRSIDDEALALYFHYQYVPAPRTIFSDTYKLLPGHYLLCDQNGLKTEQYWRKPEGTDETGEGRSIDENYLLDLLDEKLTQAVSDRLISDVPLGALLSGGIDSSLVVALMQKVNPSPVRTFSIGFSEDKYNEAPWAGKIAAFLGTNHTELYVDPAMALKMIPELPDIYDEPFADSSAVPTYLVSKLTRSHVTVALSGDGGDEQFAGYVRYWMTRTMADWLKKIPRSLKSQIARALAVLPANWVAQCYLPMRDHLPQRLRVANFQDKWQKLIMQLGHHDLAQLYRMTICLWSQPEIFELLNRRLPASRYEDEFRSAAGCPVISRLMHVDQHTYLPDCMLTKVDRASMAASIEVRVPLLDHRVVEFTSKLPESLKYRNGTGKYILKKLLARYLPQELFERPKMGFGVPIDHWMRSELKALLLDYLSPDRLRREGRFNVQLVQRKLKEHLNGTCNHHYRLWAVLMWEMWRERWLSGQR